jgi:hypothetical protein
LVVFRQSKLSHNMGQCHLDPNCGPDPDEPHRQPQKSQCQIVGRNTLRQSSRRARRQCYSSLTKDKQDNPRHTRSGKVEDWTVIYPNMVRFQNEVKQHPTNIRQTHAAAHHLRSQFQSRTRNLKETSCRVGWVDTRCHRVSYLVLGRRLLPQAALFSMAQ